jgi:hypothetical protein
VRFSVGENRMKLANATNTNRKFGKPRDLRFTFLATNPLSKFLCWNSLQQAPPGFLVESVALLQIFQDTFEVGVAM